MINWKQLNTRRSTPSSPKPESRLWKLASLAADVTSDPNAFYVSQLKSYFKPSKFKAGTKFQHLSQLPGYDLSKKSDHENDILPSTMAILEDLHDKNISTVISPLPSDSRQLQEEICRDGFFTQAPSITVSTFILLL